jgi:hypothetical protein
MFARRAASSFAVVCAVVAGSAAWASSHREAPLISFDPAADGTDLFAWRNGAAGAATVTMVADYWPLALPPAGPNYFLFDDSVLYEIKVDNNQDAKPHIIYQFSFKTTINKSPLNVPPASPGNSFLNYFAPVASPTDANILRAQTWTLTKVTIPPGGGRPVSTLVGTGPVCPWDVGVVTDGDGTTDNYTTAIAPNCVKTFGSTKVFVGPRDDPFFVNLHQTFDFLGYGKGNATSDDLAGANVLSLVVEVPATDLTLAGAAITDSSHAAADQLGFWTTASRPRVRVHRQDGSQDHHGGWTQVSRLGNPLINEAVVPLIFKDFYNASKPENDLTNYGAVVVDLELAYLMNAKGFIPKVPPAPRTDIVKVLLAPSALWANYTGTPDDVLHLDVSVPPCSATCSTLGVLGGDLAGFPNGRRLSDRVTDEVLAVVGGVVYKALGAQDAGDLYPDGGPTDYATPATALLSDNLNPLANDAAFSASFPYLANPWPGNK